MTNTTYIQTSVGLIPSDWEVKKFSDVFDYINTPSLSRDNLTFEKTNKEVKYIHYGDIHSKFKSELLDVKKEIIPYLKDEFVNENKLNFLNEGDLVIADASEDYKGIGECIELKNVGNTKIIGGLHTIVARGKENLTQNGFKTYIFNSQFVANSIRKIATGISVYGISKGNLSKLLLPLPPLPEQQKIASILSTWDTAIDNCKAIIEELKVRNKGLTQQLLTGKMRVKGFEKVKWEEFKFGYFIEEYTKKPTKNSMLPVFTSSKNGLMMQADYYVGGRMSNREDVDYNILPKDFITYRSRSDDGLFTFNKNDKEIDGLISGYYPVFKIINGNDDFFLYFLNYFKTKLTKYSSGTSQLVLSIKSLKQAKFKLPTVKEQKRIAEILNSSDIEINQYQQKLQTLQLQKKGIDATFINGESKSKNLKVKEIL